MTQNCTEDGCDNPRHVNVNGVTFKKCVKHHLEEISGSFGDNHALEDDADTPTGEQLLE
jgi:hypothetical protein